MLSIMIFFNTGPFATSSSSNHHRWLHPKNWGNQTVARGSIAARQLNWSGAQLVSENMFLLTRHSVLNKNKLTLQFFC